MRVFTMLITVVALTSCSASMNPATAAPRAPEAMPFPMAEKHLYTANRDGTPGVLLFRQQANGDVAPSSKIAGSKTTLTDPDSLALDAAGNVYVANDSGTEVAVFAAGKHGNVMPSWTIGGSRSQLGPTEGLFIDPSGNLYATDFADDIVREYPAGKHGNVAPIRSIKGSKTQLVGPTGMAMDSHGTLYVANPHAASVVAFAAGTKGNVAPSVVISGSKTGLQRPFALTFDSHGRLLVADESTGVIVFAKGASGNAKPDSTITSFVLAAGVVTDAQDRIYVADFGGGGSISVFASDAHGPATPLRTIQGPKSLLNTPNYLYLH